MKRVIQILVKGLGVVVIILAVSLLDWVNRYPKFGGNDVVKITFADSQGRVMKEMFIDPNDKWWMQSKEDQRIKISMDDVLDPFKEMDNLVDMGSSQPNCWIHIDTKTGSTYHWLVWLKKSEPAAFINGSLGTTLQFSKAYPISDMERDQLLGWLGEK